MKQSDTSTAIPDKSRIKFIYTRWYKSNLYNLILGVLIGVVLSLAISAYSGEWIGLRRMLFQILYSVVISISITNVIYIPQRFLRFKKQNTWYFLLVFYVSGLTGMIIAIELIYLIRAWLFGEQYHFFHWEDIRFSLVIVVVVCTLIYAYIAQKRGLNAKIQQRDLDLLKLKQMNTQAELAALHSKINPHFLYNSLNAIASLIHEDPDAAESMTLKLSKLFRYNINQNQEHLVLVNEEMEIVSTYLDIERVRFSDRISFEITVDDGLHEAKIPRFLIQPLVENALKHGLKDIASGAALQISLKKTAWLEISIADNGSPFPDALETGYGLQSTYDKLDLLYSNNYEIQISNHPVKQIKIQIPLRYE